MALQQRRTSADPDDQTIRFYDTELRAPIHTYEGSEIDPNGNGYQIARPMIQVLKDHHWDCELCQEAELEGELIIVE